jgi:hypothetical protein
MSIFWEQLGNNGGGLSDIVHAAPRSQIQVRTKAQRIWVCCVFVSNVIIRHKSSNCIFNRSQISVKDNLLKEYTKKLSQLQDKLNATHFKENQLQDLQNMVQQLKLDLGRKDGMTQHWREKFELKEKVSISFSRSWL